MKDEKELMKYDMVTKLALLLIEDGKASAMDDALDTVINSETYQRLMDDKAALYYQSPRYVYDFLLNEIVTGKMK
jgi:hypothetical protein